MLLTSGVALDGCVGSTEPKTNPRTESSPTTLEAVTPVRVFGAVALDLEPAPTVRVKDQRGHPMSGVAVTFEFAGVPSVPGGNRTAHRTTDVDGLASVAWMLGERAGEYNLTVTAADLASIVFTAAAHAGPIAAVTATGDAQTGLAGKALTWPLSVHVVDAYGNPVPETAVVFTVISGGGSLPSGPVSTNSLGIATSTAWTLGATLGEQRVRAQVGNFERVFTADALTSEECDRRCSDPGEIAFVRDGNIYRSPISGTDALQLTTGGTDSRPAWSRDGRRIAFARYLAGWEDVHVMDATGANIVRLTGGGNVSSPGWSPAWSPEGSRIAYGTWVGGDGGLMVIAAGADGSVPKRLGNPRGYNSDPSWSPDGTKLAFVSDYEAYDMGLDIYVTTADGSSITPLTAKFSDPANLHSYQHPTWSPDGTRIAFVYGRLFNATSVRFIVAVMNADGTGRKDLALAGDITWFDLQDPGGLSWSPDGSRIAYTSVDCDLLVGDCPGVRSVRYVTSDGGQDGLIMDNAHSPTWRP